MVSLKKSLYYYPAGVFSILIIYSFSVFLPSFLEITSIKLPNMVVAMGEFLTTGFGCSILSLFLVPFFMGYFTRKHYNKLRNYFIILSFIFYFGLLFNTIPEIYVPSIDSLLYIFGLTFVLMVGSVFSSFSYYLGNRIKIKEKIRGVRINWKYRK